MSAITPEFRQMLSQLAAPEKKQESLDFIHKTLTALGSLNTYETSCLKFDYEGKTIDVEDLSGADLKAFSTFAKTTFKERQIDRGELYALERQLQFAISGLDKVKIPQKGEAITELKETRKTVKAELKADKKELDKLDEVKLIDSVNKTYDDAKSGSKRRKILMVAFGVGAALSFVAAIGCIVGAVIFLPFIAGVAGFFVLGIGLGLAAGGVSEIDEKEQKKRASKEQAKLALGMSGFHEFCKEHHALIGGLNKEEMINFCQLYYWQKISETLPTNELFDQIDYRRSAFGLGPLYSAKEALSRYKDNREVFLRYALMQIANEVEEGKVRYTSGGSFLSKEESPSWIVELKRELPEKVFNRLINRASVQQEVKKLALSDGAIWASLHNLFYQQMPATSMKIYGFFLQEIKQNLNYLQFREEIIESAPADFLKNFLERKLQGFVPRADYVQFEHAPFLTNIRKAIVEAAQAFDAKEAELYELYQEQKGPREHFYEEVGKRLTRCIQESNIQMFQSPDWKAFFAKFDAMA